MRKIIFSISFILIGFGYLQAGLYYIEVPLTITDEMFFSNSNEVNRQLMELINSNLKDTEEEIAVVVFTRNGEPIKPLTSMNDKINENIKTSDKTDPPQDNDLYFVLKDDIEPWRDGQKVDLRWFLYEVESPDGYAKGIYYASKKLYGSPFFDYELNNYTIELYYNPGLPLNVKAVWIPPTYWSEWSDIGPGKLYLRYYPIFYQQQGSDADNARGVLAKAMLMLFWGPFYNTFDQFLSGMPYAGGTIMMNHFATIFDDFNDLFHGEKTEERPGFIFYENYNQPAISCQNINGTRFNDIDLRSYLAKYRFQMAEMAWFKVYQDSNERTYFQEFNKKMYDYGMEDVHYIPPEYGDLCKMAEGAWYICGNQIGPERQLTFNDWFNKQYILTNYDLRKYQLGVFSDEKKLRVCVYVPKVNNEKYVEECYDRIIPIRVVIRDDENTYHDEIHYVWGSTNTDHFEVNMPLVPTLRTLHCDVRINDSDMTIHFDNFIQCMDVIGGLPQLRPKLAGIVPPDNTKNNFQGKSVTLWWLRDPYNGPHIIDIQNGAFIFNDINYPDGLEGTYQLFADDELYATFTKDKEIFFETACYDPSGYEDYDKNNNGVRDEYEEPLVEKFAPILLFHNNNYLRPIQAEVYLDYHDIGDYSELYYNYHHLDIPPYTSWGDEFDRNLQGQESWLQYFIRAREHGDDEDIWADDGTWALKLKAMDPDTSYWYRYYMTEHGGFPEYANVVYYHFFHTGPDCENPDIYDETYIQFWFFYIYNLWNADNHQGDWENVVIKLDCQIPELADALALNYHYHHKILYFDQSSVYWDLAWYNYEGQNKPKRFEVFVGGKGNIMPMKNEKLKNINLDTELWSEMSGASYPHPTEWNEEWWHSVAPDTDERVEGTQENPFRLFYPDCISPPFSPTDHPYKVEGAYKYCQLNANTDNLIQGELQEEDADPMWLIYPGKWGFYCYWFGDCPKGPFYSGDWERWTDTSIMSSEEYPEYVKNPTEMKKLDDMKNNLLNNSTPYSFDSSGGYGPNSELSSIENTTYDISVYPNPCSTSAVISIPERLNNNNNEPITINIYDISGRLVRKETTTSSFTWDLTSNDGQPVSNGIYLVNISTSNANKFLKLLVAR